MKVEIPEQLKSDVPPTKWGKMLPAQFGAIISAFAIAFAAYVYWYV
jgi:hypothetical protein